MTATQHHPAQFSPEIVDAVRPIIDHYGLPVHDPFAGPGVRLGKLCDELKLKFSGTEIEPEFIVDQRVVAGDSTWCGSYPAGRHIIVTSPAYPNGMADHFNAKDGSDRHTYRQALTKITGEDRPLVFNNMGRHGVRAGATSATRHFDIARNALRCWLPAPVVLNVSDFIMGQRQYDLVADWRSLLLNAGYTILYEHGVQTKRQRHGANAHLRASHEVILVAEPRWWYPNG